MGLVTGLLTLPLAPVRFSRWVLEQLLAEAEREYTDPEPVRRALAELARAADAGEITPAEFDRCEDRLLDQLAQLTAYRERMDRERLRRT